MDHVQNPRPAGLEPNVRFWTRVFAEWTLAEGILSYETIQTGKV